MVVLPNGACLSSAYFQSLFSSIEHLQDDILQKLAYQAALKHTWSTQEVSTLQMRGISVDPPTPEVAEVARCYLLYFLRSPGKLFLSRNLLKTIPKEELTPAFLRSMDDLGGNFDTCLHTLRSNRRRDLNGISILEKLALMPPSRERSRLAMYTTACLDVVHTPLLQNRAFRFGSPAKTSGTEIQVDNNILDFLERTSLAGKTDEIQWFMDNFAALFTNESGAAQLLKSFLHPEKVQKANEKFMDLLEELAVRED